MLGGTPVTLMVVYPIPGQPNTDRNLVGGIYHCKLKEPRKSRGDMVYTHKYS